MGWIGKGRKTEMPAYQHANSVSPWIVSSCDISPITPSPLLASALRISERWGIAWIKGIGFDIHYIVYFTVNCISQHHMGNEECLALVEIWKFNIQHLFPGTQALCCPIPVRPRLFPIMESSRISEWKQTLSLDNPMKNNCPGFDYLQGNRCWTTTWPEDHFQLHEQVFFQDLLSC